MRARTGRRGKTAKLKALFGRKRHGRQARGNCKSAASISQRRGENGCRRPCKENPHCGKQRADDAKCRPRRCRASRRPENPQKIFFKTVLTDGERCAIMISQPKSTDSLTGTGSPSRGGSNHSEPPCDDRRPSGQHPPLGVCCPFAFRRGASPAVWPSNPGPRTNHTADQEEKEETQ